jgi:hypothetical protein
LYEIVVIQHLSRFDGTRVSDRDQIGVDQQRRDYPEFLFRIIKIPELFFEIQFAHSGAGHRVRQWRIFIPYHFALAASSTNYSICFLPPDVFVSDCIFSTAIGYSFEWEFVFPMQSLDKRHDES